MRHERIEIDPIGARHDDNTGGIFVIGFIAQVYYHGQFFCVHLPGNLFQHFGAGHLVWQRCNNDFPVFSFKNSPHPQPAVAGAINLVDFTARSNDFRAGGKIRSLDVGAQILNVCFGIFEQFDAGVDNFNQVVRRNIGRHAHGNTGGAV